MARYFNKNFYNIASVKDEISDLLKFTNSSVYWMFKIENVKSIWGEIVGEKLSSLTYPEYIYKNTLCVYCRHAALFQSMNFYKGEIIKKIRAKIPDLKIDDIYFSMKKKENRSKS
ncbi:MAG: DUF721 domain-containing protein [Spirochaetales bacterium]|nr:DUF721 domain-containing protein [Spirochaetales bacterium]